MTIYFIHKSNLHKIRWSIFFLDYMYNSFFFSFPFYLGLYVNIISKQLGNCHHQCMLEKIQSTSLQAHHLPTPYFLSFHHKITLALTEEIALNSSKRNSDNDAKELCSPKHSKILTHLDNTPHTSPTIMYHTSLMEQKIPGPLNRPVTSLGFSVLQSSKSILSSRVSPVKDFCFFLMTKNLVVRLNENLGDSVHGA